MLEAEMSNPTYPRHRTRRGVLTGSAAALGVAALPAWTLPRSHGGLEVLALLDAAGPFPWKSAAAFPDATTDDWARAKRLDPAAFGPDDGWNLVFRCFAVRRPGGRVTLVDTGVGPEGSPASSWAPVPGRLPDALSEVGIAVSDVERVVLTHLHEDHYGWAVLPDGTPMFPDARYVVQHAEVASLDAGSSSISYVVDPLRRAGQLHEVQGRVRVPAAGGSLTLLPTPGHTVGHQSVLVEGGRRRILITGDVLVHAVQLAAPEVSYALEADPATARRSRLALLELARERRALLATAHLNHPFIEPR
ncbi:MBL fold metallo-hydrolase [Wenjunlia vitaminophila]|uniref:MBL fold metallo-hydrolase n=2 Tax=Wenjunlia vitaminophila TaxID=76728 RepID=A0A0T6LVD8_WENVI|nr:MBL fold metallo-hydrolase [Wenjunlia vitaminophila]